MWKGDMGLSVSVAGGGRCWCSVFSTAALFQHLQKQQNCLRSSWFFFPLQLLSSTAKKEKAWKLNFSCLLHITDPLLLDVKIHALLVHPYILQLTMLVNS